MVTTKSLSNIVNQKNNEYLRIKSFHRQSMKRKAPGIWQQSREFSEDPEEILQPALLLPCILSARTVPEILAEPAVQNIHLVSTHHK